MRDPATHSVHADAALFELAREERESLLDIAGASIDHGLAHGQPLRIDSGEHSPALRETRATFVTLRRAGELRGCVGALEPIRPLVEDVAHSAFAAAFHDRRFTPLQPDERADLDIHISILGPLTPVPARNERELIERLRPGVHGLVFVDGPARSTFLPAVWESLPEPERFLAELRLKAGLARDHWSASVEVLRYEVLELP